MPSCVVVAVADEAERAASEQVAASLRARGISSEVAPSAAKFGKQIKHADRRGIPFVWFVGADGAHSVKDIRSGDQAAADPATWNPPPDDLHPRVIRADGPSTSPPGSLDRSTANKEGTS